MTNTLFHLESLLNEPGADRIDSPLTKLYVLLEEKESALTGISELIDIALEHKGAADGILYLIKQALAEQEQLAANILGVEV